MLGQYCYINGALGKTTVPNEPAKKLQMKDRAVNLTVGSHGACYRETSAK